MKHLTLGIHYPKKGCTDQILKVAKKVCEAAKNCEGLVDAGAWIDEDKHRIIMMSLWQNTEVAIKASKTLRPIIAKAPFSDWERKPSDNMVTLKRKC